MSDSSNLPATQAPRAQRIAVYDAQPLYDTAQFEHMARIAQMMGSSNLMPEHLQVMVTPEGYRPPADYRGPLVRDDKATTANAFLIVNQARLFGGIDPFALAQCSYVTRGRVGYEGKLVQAVLERAIGAMRFEYHGTPGQDGYGITVTARVPNSDPPREVSVSGTVSDWASRKSGGGLNQQWIGASSQHRMLHYRGTREWARLYAPGITLGLLDEDDLEHMREEFRNRPRGLGQDRPAALPYNPLRDDVEEGAASIEEVRGILRQEPRQEADAVQGSPDAPAAADAILASLGPVQAEAGKPAALPETGVTDQEGKATARRAPRGTSTRADAIALRLSNARSLEEVRDICATQLEPFRTEMESLGVNALSYLETMCKARDERLAALDPTPPAPAAAAVETPHDPVTGEVRQDEVQDHQAEGEEDGRDWGAWLGKFNDDAQVCTTLAAFDDLVDEVQEGESIPRKVLDAFDTIVDARRAALGRAMTSTAAGEVVTGSNDPGPHDAADALAAQESTQMAKPLTPEEALEVVDGWNLAMRQCKSIEDLEAFNATVITPFMQGPQAQFLDREMVDDAETTFRNRKRLLQAKSAQ